MPSPRQRSGDAGERIARRFLEKKGYSIVDEHVRTRNGEIDLIALDGNELVFIEVKMRTNGVFGSAEDAITDQKLARLQQAIDAYLLLYPESQPYRLDCICIIIENHTPRIRHYESCG